MPPLEADLSLSLRKTYFSYPKGPIDSLFTTLRNRQMPCSRMLYIVVGLDLADVKSMFYEEKVTNRPSKAASATSQSYVNNERFEA